MMQKRSAGMDDEIDKDDHGRSLDDLAEIASQSPRATPESSPTKKARVTETPPGVSSSSRVNRTLDYRGRPDLPRFVAVVRFAGLRGKSLVAQIGVPVSSGLKTFNVVQITFMSKEDTETGCIFTADFKTQNVRLLDGGFGVSGTVQLSDEQKQLVLKWVRAERTDIMISVIIEESTSTGTSIVRTIAHYTSFADIDLYVKR